MQKFINTKGSIWRKWDLHLHTPGTCFNDQFKNDWEGYITKLETLEDVCAIGITDYFSVKNYFKVKDYKYTDNRLSNIDLIIPNIEMRLTDSTDKHRSINYHILFSPDVDEYIESKFLANLKFQYGDRSYNATYKELVELGHDFMDCKSDEEAYREGVNQFKISINDIHRILENDEKSIFKGKYLAGAANKQGDGVSGIRHDQFKAIKENMYRKCHFIFSSNPGDREFFLKTDKSIGSPKPCIHGSDAHELEKICNPDGARYTWIKADPTFEGLLQILTEPNGRVRIQEENPNDKSDYNVIDKVVFKGDNRFQSHTIEINPGLNTIIGGKSSGKSLLLYKIASTVSKNEIDLRTKNGIWNNNYKDTFIENVEFEVHWRNGQISSNRQENGIGKVTYIPQLYINALSEDAKDDVLQKKIWEIVLHDEKISRVYNDIIEKKKRYSSVINNLSYKLDEEIKNQKSVELQLKDFQDYDFYLSEKLKLEQELDLLISKSKMSKQDENQIILKNQELDKIKGKKTEIINRLQEVSIFLSVFKELQIYVEEKLDKLNSFNDKKLQQFANDTADVIRNEIANTSKNVELYNVELSEHDTVNFNAIKILNEELLEIQSRYSYGDKIKKIREEINHFSEILERVGSLNSILSNTKDHINDIKVDLNSALHDLYQTQNECIKLINEKHEGSLKVVSEIVFNNENFERLFIENFNLRKNLSTSVPLEIINDNREFDFNPENFTQNIARLLEIIITLPEDRFKNNYNLSRIIEDLYRPYTEIILDVEKDNDIISQMSPGKRGLVLLELFLSVSNERHPILIDQPEDNLDNRTISTDLVNFIKSKSNERQIILVTHNANLVVLTDSDNVIVANQDPSIKENLESRFEYLTGSLECNFKVDGEKLNCQGIRNHACLILEGGQEAFELREMKYGFNK